MEEKKLSFFDFVNSINTKNENLYDDDNAKQFVPYMVNRSFSYFVDTVIHANEMNCMPWLDPKLQHDYLFFAIKKGKRWAGKWAKPEKNELIELFMEAYDLNRRNAERVAKFATIEMIDRARALTFKGGKGK